MVHINYLMALNKMTLNLFQLKFILIQNQIKCYNPLIFQHIINTNAHFLAHLKISMELFNNRRNGFDVLLKQFSGLLFILPSSLGIIERLNNILFYAECAV